MPKTIVQENTLQETQFLIDGMHCAGCVRRIEKTLLEIEGVALASVNLADHTAFVQSNTDPNLLIQAVKKMGFNAEILESEQVRRAKQQTQTLQVLARKKQQAILALLVGFTLMGFGLWQGMHLNENNRWLWASWAAITLITLYFSGKSFFIGAWISLKNRTSTMDTLVALSTGTAWLYSFSMLIFPQPNTHLYFEASVMIIGFINLGKYLELKTKQRSSLALEKLLDLAPQQAVIFDENLTKTIPVKAIKPEMKIQALTGTRLAVDGELLSGKIWTDEAMLTGEALPVEKNVGDTLRAGTIITDGAGVYVAKQVGSQTALARIIHAVRYAQSSKPPLAQWVDKIAAIFVPVVVSIALLSAIFWWVQGQNFAFVMSIFTTVLIIACPCALGLAIPLSTIAGVAKSAEFGVLVKNIEALQASSELDTLVFDKTGTLTTGKMTVSNVQSFGNIDLNLSIQLATTLEKHASHPIAQAIVAYAQNLPEHTSLSSQAISEIKIEKGLGISGKWQEKQLKIGNAQFVNFNENSTAYTASVPSASGPAIIDQQYSTQVYFKIDEKIVAIFTLEDQLRSDSKAMINRFQQQGYECIMLTGDRQTSADYFATQLGLDGVLAEVLPEQKAEAIRNLQAKGKKVAMIGDGINDAPALAQADVGIAMQNGSDIAIESADLSLMQAGFAPLIKVLPFSKQVLANMKQSLVGAFIYNLISIPIASGVLYPFTGWLLNPMVAAVAMTLSSITVVLNSQRLLHKSNKQEI